MRKSYQKSGRVGSDGQVESSGFGTGFAKAGASMVRERKVRQQLDMKEDFELWMKTKGGHETHEMRLRNWLTKWSDDKVRKIVAAAQIKQWMELNQHLWR